MDAADRALLSHSRKRMSELSPTFLSSAHIVQAIQRSSDGGATLLFSKIDLTDIPVAAVDELTRIGRGENESPLQRITLGYNHIATLPTAFAQLSHLRYLNLKRNNFSVFPEVLTLMPSLDTLDISHNKVKELPIEPGYLIRLRVLCISKNKITRLPTYISQFSNLEVLQVDRNPIAWPQKLVMEKAESLDSIHAMKDWIQGLQRWLEGNSQMRDDAGHSQQRDVDTYMEERRNNWRFPLSSENAFNDFAHNRSLSADSSFSTSSASGSLQEAEIPNFLSHEADRPPPLHLGILGTFSTENSPTHALESYLPSPVDSESFDSPKLSPVEHQPHVRNASYSSGLQPSMHSSLAAKKSMPDLRSAKFRFNANPLAPLNVGPSHLIPIQNSNAHDLSVLPIPQRQKSDSSLSSNRAAIITQETNTGSPTLTISSMTLERNSYFQRLSTLPTSTMLPQPLLCLIESARSILFAMCQVYQTLEYLIAHSMDDRISSVLRKVLDPASSDMTQLINSLERFDASSRKALPPAAACRGVLESCRDTVALFGKAVGVLALQLQVIVTGDDARHFRWILLELYGATAEVASVWESMVPQIDAIRPYLHTKSFPAQQPPTLSSNSLMAELYSASPTVAASRTIDPPLSSLRVQTSTPGVALNGGVRTARRHAGSFSFKDVEIGKQLPSYEDAPGSFGGVVSGTARSTPTLRAPKRQPSIPMTTISSPSPTAPAPSTSTVSLSSTIGDSSQPVHSPQGSQASFQTSASSSPSMPSNPTFLDLPSRSKTQIDKEALHAVQAAVDVAPAVWDMIENLFEEPSPPVLETITKARSVTARLSEMLQAMHDSDALFDKKDLRDDAHAFLKIVVQLSNVIRTHKGPRSVSSALRTGMVKLTNSTEEFAILLHVSSFSPSTPRPYTPLSSGAIGPEELRLGSSLSRSKSAHHAGSLKFLSIAHDGPRSALPTQTFKLPAVMRLRSRDGLDGGDPR